MARRGAAAPKQTLGEESVFIPSLTPLRVMTSKVPEPEESTHTTLHPFPTQYFKANNGTPVFDFGFTYRNFP